MHRPKTRSTRSRLVPRVDRLEGRALMAVAGTLDPTFGGGTVFGSLTSGPTTAVESGIGTSAVAAEANGSAVVAHTYTTATGVSIAASLYNADGTLDTSFGTSGQVVIPDPAGYVPTVQPQVLIQPNGQIIIAGQVSDSTSGVSGELVARLNVDGSLDSSFGTGGVQLVTGLGSGYVFAGLEPDGAIALVGATEVAQLTAAGAPDPSFGTDGLAPLPYLATQFETAQELVGMVVQPNNQIVALVTINSTVPGNLSTGQETALIRLNADGSRDTTFDESGVENGPINTGANSMVVEPNGDFALIGGSTASAFDFGIPTLEVIDPTGALVTSKTYLDDSLNITNLTLQPDGDLATLVRPDTPFNYPTEVLRLTPQLAADPTFGAGGLATITLPAAAAGNANLFQVLGLASTPSDQLLLSGSNDDYATGSSSPPGPSAFFASRLAATATPATPGDYTGDGVSDPAVYLTGTGTFVIGNSSGGAGQVVQFGSPGLGNSIPAPGDYFATGQEDIAVYLPNLGVYAIRNPTDPTDVLGLPIGIAGPGQTIPAPGDYYGAGSDQVAIYLAQAATWDILAPGLNPGLVFHFGQPGVGNTIPVPGDYYGTGQDDVAVYLPQTATWSILAPGLGSILNVQFGIPGAGNTIPVPGDYDGSGKTELAVYLPSLGEIQYIPAGTTQVKTILFGIPGAGNTLPEPGDYDGSGKTEAAAYLPGLNTFVYRPADGGGDIATTVGFTDQGPIVPVTQVVPSSLLPTASASTNAIEIPGAMGEADELDFVMPLASDAKKHDAAGSSGA